MRQQIVTAITAIASRLYGFEGEVELTRPDEQFGDYATNIALQLAKVAGKNPREVAETIAADLRADVGAFSASLPVLLRTFTDWRVVLGFALIFSGALFWLGVISRADFSFAYPLLALSYVIALLPAWLVLGESVTPNRIVGALVVVAGALIIGWEQR